jgi:hypothetical protein
MRVFSLFSEHNRQVKPEALHSNLGTRARVAASTCIIVPALSVSKDLFDGDAALLCVRVNAELGLRRHCSQLFSAGCGLATPPNMALNTAKLAS